MAAGGKIKQTATTHELEAVVSQRLYLSDASFLVALLGNTRTVGDVAGALRDPRWPPYLGRKACVPSSPIFIRTGSYSSLEEALESEPWRARLAEVDGAPCELRAVLEARLASGSPVPADAVAVADVPVSFAPPVPLHEARYVVERTVRCRVEGPTQTPCPCPGRPWVDYRSPQWKQARAARAKVDLGLCVFCKQPMVDVHHVDYSHAGAEPPEDLRSLCRLCHDAISMIEYGGEAGTRRVDPCDHRVRALVLQKRGEILAARRVRGGPRRRR
jgi:5-methylcytosine-specific restriction endonuclease McrA